MKPSILKLVNLLLTIILINNKSYSYTSESSVLVDDFTNIKYHKDSDVYTFNNVFERQYPDQGKSFTIIRKNTSHFNAIEKGKVLYSYMNNEQHTKIPGFVYGFTNYLDNSVGLDISGCNTLRFTFSKIYNTFNLAVCMDGIKNFKTTIDESPSWSNMFQILPCEGKLVIDLSLDQLLENNDMDRKNLNKIGIHFQGENPKDLSYIKYFLLEKIEFVDTVPEPFSTITLGVGTLAFIRKRKALLLK